MARLNTRASTTDSLYRDRTPNVRERSDSPLSTPRASFSSDKENQMSSRTASGSKRSAQASGIDASDHVGKKRRFGEQGHIRASRQKQPATSTTEQDEDKRFYDPEQDPEERRKVRQGMRNNIRELHERADEILNNDDGKELLHLLNRQNVLMNNVKQTADATIDSRFLLTASEQTLKKSKRLAHGDGSIGIDIDEFVSKCMSFMRFGRTPDSEENSEPAPTHASRNRRLRGNDDDDDEENDGNALNWQVLGERACFPNNRRPAVPNFLLGPLSVEKRVRTTQRRTGLRREEKAAVSRPQELTATDLERNEESNLTSQCQRIRKILDEVIRKGVEGVEAEADEDADEEEARALFRRHNLAMNWQVPLIRFILNPNDFGQSVENLFYVSFLVKDGLVSLELDDQGNPTIKPNKPKTASESRDSNAAKFQQIQKLNYRSWQIFKEATGLKESLIPHRQVDMTQVNGRGWYG